MDTNVCCRSGHRWLRSRVDIVGICHRRRYTLGGPGEQGCADLLVMGDRAVVVGATTEAGASPSDGLILAVSAPFGPTGSTSDWAGLSLVLTILYVSAIITVLALSRAHH